MVQYTLRAVFGIVLASLIASSSSTQWPRMIGRGVISTPADEFGGAITPDGQTIFFNRSVPRSYLYYICVAHRSGDSWTKPEVASFSGRYRDSDPVLSPDGRRLYFVSDRDKKDFDIYVVTGSNEPRNLGPPVNSDGNEYFASEAADGSLYFASNRKGSIGAIDIWRSRRDASGKYSEPENLGPVVNGAGVATIEVLIAPDQSFMIIGAFGRATDPGNSDLYAVERKDGQWTAPRALSREVNTAAREYSPRFSPDGKMLIFASERGFPTETRTRAVTYDEITKHSRDIDNGLGNIYEIPLAHEGLPDIEVPRFLGTSVPRVDPPRNLVSEEPRNLVPKAELVAPGIISTPAPESGGAFTPDGTEFYFTVRNPTTTTTPVAAICVSRLRNGKWQKPEVASFSGHFFDYAPSISPSGRFLVFTSARPVDGKQRFDTDLYVVERRGKTWGEPRNIGAPVNSEGNEQGSSIAADGSLYFSSDAPGGQGGLDLYRAPSTSPGSWGKPEPIKEINSKFSETHPFITRDGKSLFFVSVGRPDDLIAGGAPYARGEIYVTEWRDGKWSEPQRLPNVVNTPASDTYPVVSPDGIWLYYTSEISSFITPLDHPLTTSEADRLRETILNGGGNIYRVPLASLGQ